MRNVLRVWKFLVVGVSLGMTILWVTPVDATPLSNTPISWSTFISFANIGNPVVPPLIDYFDFSPPHPDLMVKFILLYLKALVRQQANLCMSISFTTITIPAL